MQPKPAILSIACHRAFRRFLWRVFLGIPTRICLETNHPEQILMGTIQVGKTGLTIPYIPIEVNRAEGGIFILLVSRAYRGRPRTLDTLLEKLMAWFIANPAAPFETMSTFADKDNAVNGNTKERKAAV